MNVGLSQPPENPSSLSPVSPSPVLDLNTSLHITVLLDEAVDALAIKPAGIYVDGTFGRGGHSRRILERLGEQGRLIALDREVIEVLVSGLMVRSICAWIKAADRQRRSSSRKQLSNNLRG